MLVKIKDVCQVVSGATPSTSNSSYYDGNIFWITPKDLADNNNRKYIHDCGRKITTDGYNSCSTVMIPKNNILISTRAPIGYMAINRVECCTNQGFKSLICDTKKVVVDYLFYLLKSRMNEIELLGSGTTFKEVSKTSIENFEIELPSLEAQEQIASILSQIDDQIERNNTMVKKLQVLGKAIFEQFAINSTNKINVQEIANVIWGQCPEGKNIIIEKINNSIPYASGAGDIDDGKLVINPKAYTNNSRRIVKAKTICMSVAGTIGKIGIADDETSIGRAMLGLYSNSKYGLIYFALLKYSLVLQTQATGAIQKIINNDHLDIIDIPDLLSSQIDKLNKIVDECIIVEKNTQELTHLKEILLPLLINGQLE